MTRQQWMEMLDYSLDSGEFRWKVYRGGGSPREGAIAGSIDSSGHRQIKVSGKMYAAHRLAWLFVYGEWPNGDLDHINLYQDDNRIANLRLATRAQNAANRGLQSNSTSGFRGVHYEKATGRWLAHIGVGNGKKRKLGRFGTAQEAYAAYCKAAQEQWGEFARTA